ncbi:MAG: 1-acyl-sn-glycerol-3-phosphate acyltransferase [Pseudomonadales bacterium]|nr:1-acyl-sn-glycerol-3-phosphate acyltransferase [Pseudomonadales bacterium]
MFNIQSIVQTKFPDFCQKHKIISSALIAIACKITKDKEFRQFKADHADRDGIQLIDDIYNYLNFTAIIHQQDLDNIPKTGRLVMVLNHPTTLDGLSLIQHLSTVRSDIKVVVNELFETTGAMHNYTIPVDISGAGISKSSLKALKQHLQAEGVLIIFPGGKPSRIYDGKIQDPEWSSSFLKIARKYGSPILPVYIDGKMSRWFYFISKVFFPLSMLLVFREIFNLRNKTETFYFGEMIEPQTLEASHASVEQQVQAVRDSLYALSPKTDINRL